MTTSARDTLWLLFILIIVGVIYSMSGRGIDFSNIGRSGPRLSPGKSSETTLQSESIFGGEERIIKPAANEATTPNSLQITISVQAAQNTDPQKEYITIINSGAENINLNGVKLKNKNNEEALIEADENGKPVILLPRDIAYVLTGKSTKGANFKTNKCSGYFNQFHQFTPSISGNCPTISDLPETEKLSDLCFQYLPQLKSCQVSVSLPTDLESECQNFIERHASYTGCVQDHKNDKNFDQGEWRIFLNRTTEFWAKRNETIKLIDQSGKTLSEISY